MKRLMLIALLACVGPALAEDRNSPPPGYALEVDQHGNFRPVRERSGEAVFGWDFDDDAGTRAAALRRAWQQHDFEHKFPDSRWERICPKEAPPAASANGVFWPTNWAPPVFTNVYVGAFRAKKAE